MTPAKGKTPAKGQYEGDEQNATADGEGHRAS